MRSWLHRDRVTAQGDSGVHAAEVVAVGDLLGSLVNGVVDLLAVELGNNVEGGVGHEGHLSLKFRQSKFRLALGSILMLFFHGTARAMQGNGY